MRRWGFPGVAASSRTGAANSGVNCASLSVIAGTGGAGKHRRPLRCLAARGRWPPGSGADQQRPSEELRVCDRAEAAEGPRDGRAG